MFKALQQRLRDSKTLTQMCVEAERIANAEGQAEAGAEHFVLAALEMDDGTARRAFERVGADPDGFRPAIDRQYADALAAVGLQRTAAFDAGLAQVPVPPGQGLYKAKPSVSVLIRLLTDAEALQVPANPLLGAHVVLAAARAEQSTAVRALRAMGIDPGDLASAAGAEILSHMKP